jgi:hypothetical protein
MKPPFENGDNSKKGNVLGTSSGELRHTSQEPILLHRGKYQS